MIGSKIGNYNIVSKIGEGGMGSVFLGEHIKLNRKVAIKSLHDVLIKNEEIKERFRIEAEAMSKLQNENIINLLDYEENENGLFLIMEYVNGVPLDELLKANSIPYDQSLTIIRSVLEGLQYAHKKGIVHRDIKPSNILIDGESMSPKILDFGIAKMLGSDHSMTKTGAQMGTVYFMSPEQVRGEQIDQRSDIYSVGVTLFQLINGSNPYASITTEYEVYNKIVNEELPIIKDKDVPEGVSRIIAKATAKKVSDRYKSCQEMIDEIDQHNNGGRVSGVTSKMSLIPWFVGIGTACAVGLVLFLNWSGFFGDEDTVIEENQVNQSIENDAPEEEIITNLSLCQCWEMASEKENWTDVTSTPGCEWIGDDDSKFSDSEIINAQKYCPDLQQFYMVYPNNQLDDLIDVDYCMEVVHNWCKSLANNSVSRFDGFQSCEINRFPFNDWSVYSSSSGYGSVSSVDIESCTISSRYRIDFDYARQKGVSYWSKAFGNNKNIMRLQNGLPIDVTLRYVAYDPVNGDGRVTQKVSVLRKPNGSQFKIIKIETMDFDRLN